MTFYLLHGTTQWSLVSRIHFETFFQDTDKYRRYTYLVRESQQTCLLPPVCGTGEKCRPFVPTLLHHWPSKLPTPAPPGAVGHPPPRGKTSGSWLASVGTRWEPPRWGVMWVEGAAPCQPKSSDRAEPRSSRCQLGLGSQDLPGAGSLGLLPYV